jgi:hypothetical protein
LSRSIPKKRGIVKPVKGKKPARYTQKVDSRGRRYTIDNKSGKRVSNELWERERAKSRPKAKSKPKSKAKAPKTRAQSRPLPEPPVSIPRNIFDVWDIPNAEWKRTHEPTPAVFSPLSGREWTPDDVQWSDDDDAILFPEDFAHEKAEREAELAFRAAKAERDRELLQNAEEFIPTTRIKGFSEGILERAERYPRVKIALDYANAKAVVARHEVMLKERKPTVVDQITDRFLRALEDDEDIEGVVGDLADEFEYEVHDIYEIYFSPEVA